ncbi:two-component system response regulator NarL [Solemya pervernicosa gill symbiont]|uniref:Two-component system response regulator NarL n=2 Tax=Gammaproteobacteria incertae sedis TaxID=118884 RepID=A0A1T2L6G0_9GAMM|nr:response regulator [Candidatus Reidiella endopervernicosa]OOZ40687.1 two-component system response regulator NarL [Solemya pervernicosa gill symbiont]QKQ26750.1 response regulator [Candidatus Reidiella endopervernicosa]
MKVLVIDDHALFRVGLEGLLEKRGIEVTAVASGSEGLEIAPQLNPDVVLLDMRMPDMSGIEVLTKVRNSGLEMPAVMLTTSDDEQDLIDSLRNGAQGYLLKDMEPDELVSALRNIVAGKTVIAPDLAGVLAKVVQQGDGSADEEIDNEESNPFSELTPREKEILCLLAEGQSNKAIARNLGITDGTVKLHVKAVLRKLSVHSRVEAAVIAVEQGVCNKSVAERDQA